MRRIGWLVLCAMTLSLQAQEPAPRTAPERALERKIDAMVTDPKVARDHWGVAVYGLDGRLIAGLNEGQLFQPASTAKLFTTAAALAVLGPSHTYETRVRGWGVWTGSSLKGDLTIMGGGDASLSGRDYPYTGGHSETGTAPPLRYLEQMADEVAATGLKSISGDVIGNDGAFPWEPYPVDWAVDDLVWGYGAPVSALTVNDNQIKVTVAPGGIGQPASIAVEPDVPYYTIENQVTTGPARHGGAVQFERLSGSKTLRIYGTIAADSSPDAEEIAIQDPAEYAAIAFKTMLEARGVAISGVARAEHAPSLDLKGFQSEARESLPGLQLLSANEGWGSRSSGGCTDCGGIKEVWLATHTAVSVGDDIVMTNKVSQNLHAELLLHQLGGHAGDNGSGAQGARVVRAFLLKVGLSPDDFIFYDGSGLSGHDLVTPRAEARLLLYAMGQSWGALYKSSLPIGGVDGTLSARFVKSPLKGKIWAKTGTTGESRALAGYVQCASGRTVVFSIMVGNHPPGTTADREVMDRIVEAIAAAN